jgi:hypothetical protein
MPLPKSSYDLIVGLDTSVHNIGVAIYECNNFIRTEYYPFKDTYCLDSLFKICETIETEIFGELRGYKRLLLIEEPLPPVRNSKAISMLNQVAGALAWLGKSYGFDVRYINNRTVKNRMGITTKEDSIKKVRKLYKDSIRKGMTDHESDAVLLVETFYTLGNEKDLPKKSGKARVHKLTGKLQVAKSVCKKRD